ncbi:MAG TPA: hotdog fold domain-containing protein [Propionibacteriaceae bacterium]|nr:hotdog fold domain-containing protein [Propionibacteriaceae bacterium]
MTSTYGLYERLSRLPLGSRIFSLLYALKAPYFRTVRPQVRVMAPHHAEVVVPLRWGVRNHIGTLHAIAAVNGLEAAMGLLAEATCPEGKRWIPVGMTVRYVAKATTDLLCVAATAPADWEQADVPVRVTAVRRDGVSAVEGVITIRVSDRPAR